MCKIMLLRLYAFTYCFWFFEEENALGRYTLGEEIVSALFQYVAFIHNVKGMVVHESCFPRFQNVSHA